MPNSYATACRVSAGTCSSDAAVVAAAIWHVACGVSVMTLLGLVCFFSVLRPFWQIDFAVTL
jgi:hypothetical protein